jgi:hypothetical protein
LEKILNDPRTSPFTQPQTYNAILTATKQSITESLRHIGGKSNRRPTAPSDEDKAKARIEKLEASAQ